MPPTDQPPATTPQGAAQPMAPAAQAYQQQSNAASSSPANAVPQMQPAQPAANPNAGKPTDSEQKPNQPAQTTTQSSLLFSEIRDGMIVMSDGSFRAIIGCESINFDLMSNREREGIEFSYQNFLNSLTFPIQIFIRSKRVDIAPYIERLDNIRRNHDNMLLNVLMDDYINFVDLLAENANIMDKSFYIVVPYFPEGDAAKLVEQSKGFFSKIFGSSKQTVTRIDKQDYEKAKDEIRNRIDSVTSGLFQIGVRCAQLNTKELGELYYNIYNPDTAVNQPMPDFSNNTTTFVRKGDGQAPRVGSQPEGGA